jgi:O-antigen ligase
MAAAILLAPVALVIAVTEFFEQRRKEKATRNRLERWESAVRYVIDQKEAQEIKSVWTQSK